MRTPARTALAAALAGVALISAPAGAQHPAAPCARPLAERPGGPPIGCLEEGVEVSVRERADGWARIWLEAWVPEVTPAGTTASLSLSITGPDSTPAAGASVRLLENKPEIDEGLASLRRRHAASRSELLERQTGLERELERALFSSDNLTQATEHRRRLRAEKEALERQRQELAGASRAEALALLQRHQAGIGTTDAAGRIVLSGLAPGSYLVLATTGAAGQTASWWVPVSLSGGERRTLEMSASGPRQSPFADLD